jgi:hypothetical protein
LREQTRGTELKEHHDQSEHHHLGHARGGEEINSTGQGGRHVRPDRQQTSSTDQVGEQANGK